MRVGFVIRERSLEVSEGKERVFGIKRTKIWSKDSGKKSEEITKA